MKKSFRLKKFIFGLQPASCSQNVLDVVQGLRLRAFCSPSLFRLKSEFFTLESTFSSTPLGQ